MHVVKKELMYVSKPFRGEGGKGLQRAQYVFLKKSSLRALRAHNVCTYYARTSVVHRVHQRAACPSWGSPPWGLKTLEWWSLGR